MHLTLTSTFLAILLAVQVNAQSLIAFSGNDCNGDAGIIVPCDGTCFDFTGRHSYEILGSSATVELFEDADCSGEEFTFGPDPPNECIDVITGTPITTFRCF
ncbi:hypothetical protein MSAN_02297500 [Mycena sanguinolenta]|uniref:Uncharacterized protein n=1 Tax=Mycena sanguinolenta TaxID=230812 RepID=A0A8H6X8B1_9AGAR|nr:hypothetical protein MSAN_02297500 [Mycena sanguinolenta]